MSKTIEKNCERRFGCSYSDALCINGEALDAPGSMAAAYTRQRYHAVARGVEWNFTFPEWAQLWRDSGKWNQRGKRTGDYCMARHGDVGPYAVGNVSIVLFEVNAKEGRARATPNPANAHQARLGSGRGWTLDHRRADKPFVVRCREKYVGSFATQEEAEAAYASALLS